MGFPYGPTNMDALTTGSNVSAVQWGADVSNGTGTRLVVEPGLFGSAKCCQIVCSNQHREYRTAVTGTRQWVSFDFQVPDGPPDPAGPAVTGFLRCLDADDAIMALVYFTAAGIIKVRDDGTDAVGDTNFNYCGDQNSEGGAVPGGEYHLLYRIDSEVGKQKLWIYRDGHFKVIDSDGLPIGPNPIAFIEIGLTNSASTFTINIDNPMVTDVEQTLPDPVYINHVIPGNPRTDGVDLLVDGYGYNAFRARIFEPAGIDATIVSDSFDAPLYNRTAVAVATLDAGTEYEFEIEGLRDSTWQDTGYARGSFKTAPRPKYPSSGLFFMTGCEFDQGISLPKDTTWTPALLRGYDAWWHGGDLTYANLKTLQAGPFRDAIASAIADRPVMGQFFASTTNLGYNPSDHDGGGGQIADTQDPSTEYAIQAWLDSWPHAEPWHPGECRSTSVTWGRTRFVMPDFRTLARSDSDDPDTDAKIAYSLEDEAIIIAELNDDTHALVVLCFDQPWPGAAIDVVPKDDHMANYPNQRARINAAIAARLARGMGCFIVQADYHGLVWRNPGLDIDDTTGGAGLIGIAGSWNDTGNIRAGDLGNYTGYWGEEQDPDPEFDIAVSGELEITDDGTTITVVGRCLDNDNGVTRGTVTDSWAIPFVVPPAAPPSYDLGEFPCTQVVGSGFRWFVSSGTELPAVPPQSASVVSPPFTHGRRIADGYYDGGRVVLELTVFDLDANGTHGGRLQVDANIDAIKGAVRQMRGSMLGWRPQHTEGVTRQAPGWCLASVPVTYVGQSAAVVTIVVDLEHEFRAPSARVWSRSLADGNVDNVAVSTLTGSTAAAQDLLYRWEGSFRTTAIFDVNSGQFIRVTVPDDYFTGETDPDALPEDMAIVLGNASGDGTAWDVWLVDAADEFDVSGGTLVNDWLDSSLNGEAPLILNPVMINGDPDVREVRVDLKVGTPVGNPMVQIRTRTAYH